MKTKNFVVEVIQSEDGVRTFIVRELAPAPNVPPVTRFVTSDPSELATFFGSSELISTDNKNN